MFTGIIERVGTVRHAAGTEDGRRITVATGTGYLDTVAIGDSIAVDGVCLTVVSLEPGTDASFDVEVIGTTLSRTTTGRLKKGSAVNLERALPLGGRLGGHMVQGHVDAVGIIERIERDGEQTLLQVSLPVDVANVTVLHGSIAIHGVSLTVNTLPNGSSVEVALIPHTLENTNLRHLVVGDAVNLEGDMLGKFVVNYLQRTAAAKRTGE